MAAFAGTCRRPRSRAAADADLGPGGDLPETQDEPAEPGTPRLSVPTSRSSDRPARPGLVCGRLLYPDVARFSLSGRDHGLGQSVRSGMASVQHAARRLLRRCRGSGPGDLRQAGHLQHRSGRTIHQRRLYRRSARSRRPHQHGWQGTLHGQHFRRAAVALTEVRGGLSQGLRKRR